MTLTQVTTGGVDENINIDGDTLKIDGVNNRVGVGITPTAPLHVSGTIQSQTGSTVAQMFTDGGAAYFTSVGAYPMLLHTNGSERMRIDTSGRLLIGGTNTYHADADNLVVQGTGNVGVTIASTSTGKSNLYFADSTSNPGAYACYVEYDHNADDLKIGQGNSERLRIDSSGNVGIGSTSPGARLEVKGSASAGYAAQFTNSTESRFAKIYVDGNGIALVDDNFDDGIEFASNTARIYAGGSERMRIDSGGRVLVGSTSNHFDNAKLQVVGTQGLNYIALINTTQTDSDGSRFSFLHFRGTQSGGEETTLASIGALHDSGNDDENGRLSFRVNDGNDGSNPTERYRISSSGRLSGGTTLAPTGDAAASYLTINANYNGNTAVNITGNSGNTSQSGTYALRLRQNVDNNQGNSAILRIDHTNPAGASGGEIVQVFSNRGNSTAQKVWVLHREGNQDINRPANDGVLISLRQNNTQEGTISVSGSSVSYNGGHLARWSQLEGGAERTEILRGSVLSNLDEMCEWIKPDTEELLWTQEDLDMYLLNGDEGLPGGAQVGDVKEPATSGVRENNEQLNRMKVSDVEGDVNVAGVFQCWDDDDDTYTNDFYCAMTGDFVIRIAQGTTVARGDLLMSAGDGTAKPQDDDIVRSKTIAKVTSTTVSTTYADGSYCVPCVLMAC